jgi:hypothetical protein
MKLFFLTLICCLLIAEASAQSLIELIQDNVHVAGLPAEDNSGSVPRQIKVRFRLWGTVTADQKVHLEIPQASARNFAEIINPDITFVKTDFKPGQSVEMTKDVYLKIAKPGKTDSLRFDLAITEKKNGSKNRLGIQIDTAKPAATEKKDNNESSANNVKPGTTSPASDTTKQKNDSTGKTTTANTSCNCIKMGKKENTIYPLLKKDTSTIVPVTVHLRVTDTCKTPVKVNFALQTPYQYNSSLTLIKSSANVDPKTKNKDGFVDVTLYLEQKGIDTFNYDEDFYITLADCTVNDSTPASTLVRVSQVGMYNPNKPFWVELGANFDLLDGLQANNLYGGVFLYKKDIRPFFRKDTRSPGNRNLGIMAGVYESKSTSQESTAQLSPLMYFKPNKMIGSVRGADSFYAYLDTGKIAATTTVTSTGLFFSPQVRLTNGSAEDDGIHVFASFWMEMVWQRYKTTYDYSQSALYDSTIVVKGTDQYNKVGTKPQDQTRDVRSHYFGLGLPVFAKFKDANLFVNSVVGYTNQMLALADLRPVSDSISNSNFIKYTKDANGALNPLTTPKKNWNCFYIFQFRLSEETFGLSFTGEIRGLMLKNVKPVISLALSKKFDLNKLMLFK